MFLSPWHLQPLCSPGLTSGRALPRTHLLARRAVAPQVLMQTMGTLYAMLGLTMMLHGVAGSLAFLETNHARLGLAPGGYTPIRWRATRLFAKLLGGKWGQAMPWS